MINKVTIATAYPLFLNLANNTQAALIANVIERDFLKQGGVLTTLFASGQQWDAPNGWAPLQWVAFKGLLNYGFNELADTIETNWTQLVEHVFEKTGGIKEKYNVVDTSQPATGGEYPNQDGFGWTNGIYLKMKQKS
jgi:alpha,alpha-trehalase